MLAPYGATGFEPVRTGPLSSENVGDDPTTQPPAAHSENMPGREAGFGQVVEEPPGEDDVEDSLEWGRQEVLDNQHGPLGVRLKAGTGEPDHRLGEVDAHLVAGAGLEHELADPAQPAADVEHSRLRVLADGVDGQVAAPHQPWPSSRTSGRSSS